MLFNDSVDLLFLSKPENAAPPVSNKVSYSTGVRAKSAAVLGKACYWAADLAHVIDLSGAYRAECMGTVCQ